MDNASKPLYQMGPFPWKWKIFEQHQNIGISDASGAYSRATIVHNSIRSPWDEKDAEAIVKAMNGTWGEGINPEAVKEMYDALKQILAVLFNPDENITNSWHYDLLKAAKRTIEKAKITTNE